MSLGSYVKVPAALVEHLWLLTPAEIALSLVVLRRGSRAGAFIPVTISESNWIKWTGLGARQREYAIAGLREKGLSVNGHGDTALFSFDLHVFRSFAASAVRSAAVVRTKGRKKGVPVPAGTIVHEDCKQHGCQMLCGSTPQSACIQLPSPMAASSVPVPPYDADSVAAASAPAPVDLKRRKSSGLVSTEQSLVSKPVGRRMHGVDTAAAGLYPVTLRALHQLGFSLCGHEFIVRLVDSCRVKGGALPDGCTDELLARAVGLAYEARRRYQKSEGLFLVTVAPVVLSLLKGSAAPAAYTCSECGDLGTVIQENGHDEFGAILLKVPCSR
jgi:hypothetical protein